MPPWTLTKPVCHLIIQSKIDAIPQDINSRLLKIISETPNKCILYTDGSKNNVSTGCAYVGGGVERKYKLSTLCSSFTAEAFAIMEALRYAMTVPEQNIIICTDSQSVLSSIAEMYSRNKLIQQIQSFISMMKQTNKEVLFLWVPGHTGVRGNEDADKAANAAHDMSCEKPVSLSPKEMAVPLLNLVFDSWLSMWNEAQDNKLRAIKAQDLSFWKSSVRVCRREEVVLARLRLGHSRLTHGYLMRGEEPPQCGTCMCPLSVRHIFEDCLKFREQRAKHRIPPSIAKALGDDVEMTDRIIDFCKETKLFELI